MSIRYDLPLIGATLFLLSWGTVMIYSTGGVFADLQYNDGQYFLYRHLFHVLAGLVAMGIALAVNYKKWKQLSIWMMLGILVLLILVLIPEVGHEVKGGRRWLRYGSLSIQPAELLKVTLIIYVASYLERKQELLASFFRGLTPNFIVTGIYLFLVLLQPDFGNVILIATTVLLMLYVGGGRPVHIAGSLIGMGIIAGLLIASHSYRVQRMLAFLNPWDDPQNSGFQIIQSFIALGTGGWLGRGLGESFQKRLFLPDAQVSQRAGFGLEPLVLLLPRPDLPLGLLHLREMGGGATPTCRRHDPSGCRRWAGSPQSRRHAPGAEQPRQEYCCRACCPYGGPGPYHGHHLLRLGL